MQVTSPPFNNYAGYVKLSVGEVRRFREEPMYRDYVWGGVFNAGNYSSGTYVIQDVDGNEIERLEV